MKKNKTNKLQLIILIFVVCALKNIGYSQVCEKVIDVSFNNYQDNSKYTVATATHDFGYLQKRAAGDNRGLDGDGLTWPQQNVISGGALRAQYPANKILGPETGFLFDTSFADTEEAIMEYRVKFGPDFYWAYGGKLPGLGGSDQSKSRGLPDGLTKDQNTIQNGFSARLMWRPLSYTPAGKDAVEGRIVFYTYLPYRDINKGGVDMPDRDVAEIKVVGNQWYTIKQHLKLNTLGQSNGILELFVNGVSVYKATNVVFRRPDKPNVKINAAIFQSYRGGSTVEDFASPKTEYIYFDDFKVWRSCASTNPVVVVPGGNNTLINGAVYKITSKLSGKCVDVQDLSKINGGNVQQYGYGGGNNQKWKAESLAGGYWKFTSMDSGKCLEVGNYSNDNGNVFINGVAQGNVRQWDYVGNDYQQWKIEPSDAGSFKFTNKGSLKVMDVSGISLENGANIYQYTWINADNQKWLFERVDNLNSKMETETINKFQVEENTTKLLYPNPTSGIALLDVLANTNIKIFDMTGKLILERNATSATTLSLDLFAFNAGIYIVQITNNEETKSQKLILQK